MQGLGSATPIVLKFDKCLDSSAVMVPVKFQSDTTILTPNLTALRLTGVLLFSKLKHWAKADEKHIPMMPCGSHDALLQLYLAIIAGGTKHLPLAP